MPVYVGIRFAKLHVSSLPLPQFITKDQIGRKTITNNNNVVRY